MDHWHLISLDPSYPLLQPTLRPNAALARVRLPALRPHGTTQYLLTSRHWTPRLRLEPELISARRKVNAF